MQLESISNLFNDVRLEVPGAPNPLIQDRARYALTEFCKRTLISNETLQTYDIEAGEPLIYIHPPNSCVNIWRVMWVKTSQRFLHIYDRQQLASHGSDWDKSEDEWPSIIVPHSQNNIFQLYPKPTVDKDDELTVHCAFIPHPQTTKMDSVVYQFYREAIVKGAVAKLQKMAGTKWYNPEAGMMNEHEFQVELSKAKANQNKDNSIADVSVMMAPFA